MSARDSTVTLRNLKPSKLPIGTVIEYEDEWYVKKEAYYGVEWTPVSCEDCGGVRAISLKDEDTVLKEFKLIALPPNHSINVESLHGEILEGPIYLDGTSVFHNCNGVNCEA